MSGEAGASWWIGLSYENIGDLAKAEEHIAHAVQIAEKIGHPSLDGMARWLGAGAGGSTGGRSCQSEELKPARRKHR